MNICMYVRVCKQCRKWTETNGAILMAAPHKGFRWSLTANATITSTDRRPSTGVHPMVAQPLSAKSSAEISVKHFVFCIIDSTMDSSIIVYVRAYVHVDVGM